MRDTDGKVACDWEKGCAAPVARLDSKGYVYCEPHGAIRKDSGRACRRLRPWEQRRLERGKELSRY